MMNDPTLLYPSNTPWTVSRSAPALPPGLVQIWRVPVPSVSSPYFSINVADDSAARLELLITAEEQERRDRFRQPDDRRRFARARGLLRALLGQLLNQPPLDLVFVTGPSGKPSLPPSSSGPLPGPPPLHFNVSHSHEWILVALALDREVGVDVEHGHPRVQLLDLARRFFSPWEVAALEALPPGCHDAAFYRIWACKESFVKAIGKGLSAGLDRFSMRGAAEGAPAVTLVWEEPAEESSDWTTRLLDVGPAYAAAVTVEGQPPRMLLCEWA
jgi:4'-phosphopantetheinyl transferase